MASLFGLQNGHPAFRISAKEFGTIGQNTKLHLVAGKLKSGHLYLIRGNAMKPDLPLMLVAASYFFVSSFCAQELTGQIQKVTVKVGDKVQVQWFKEWYDGEVTSVIANGMRAKVKFTDSKGRERDWPFGAKDIRKAKPPTRKLPSNKFRIWTSSDGKFTLKAKFAGESDGKVKLEKDDGKSIEVALDQLSEKDNQFVEKLVAQMKKADVSDNPFANAREVDPNEVTSKPKGHSKPKVAESAFAAYPLVQYDAKEATPISLKTDQAFRPFAESMKASAIEKDAIVIAEMKETAGSLDNLVFNRDQSKAVMSWKIGFVGRDGMGFCVFDPASGKSLGEKIVSMPKTSVVDINSDGTLILTQSMTFSKQPRLDLWKRSDDKIEHHAGWQLPKKDASPGATPQFAAFTADDKVVSMATTQQIVFWDTHPVKPLAFINRGDHFYSISKNGFAISQDRQKLYVVENGAGLKPGSLIAIDLVKREPAGRSKIEFPAASVGVSPDGQNVALLGNRMIQIYDKEMNKLDEFTTTFNSFFDKIRWLNDEFLVCYRGGTATVIDRKSRAPLWTYKFGNWFNSSFMAFDSGGTIWEGIGTQYHRVRIPHADALKVRPTDPESQLVFRPGMSIFLDIRIGSGKVYDSYSKQLTDLGLKVVRDPAADLVLMATKTTGKPQTTEYRVIGDPLGPKTETVTTRSVSYSVDVMQKGQRIWGVGGGSSGGAPSFLHLGSGESAQSAVNRLNGTGGSGEGYFASIRFIKNVIKQPYGGAFGQSTVKGGVITNKPFPKPTNGRGQPARGGLAK